MADMRSCIKTGCRWPAAATLSYRYATAEAWLSDLGEPHPATHDLCPHHADALRIPRGWTMVDDRRPIEVVREPSAAELVDRVTTLRRSVDLMLEAGRQDPARPVATRRSRYEALLDSLPTSAPPADAEADEAADPARDADGAHPSDRDDDADADTTAARMAEPVLLVPARGPIAHELAPVPAAVHEPGLRGAVVLTLPLRTPGEDPDRPPPAGPHDDGVC